MASQLGYSEWSNIKENMNSKKERKNKTLKRKPSGYNNNKVSSFLNSMKNESKNKKKISSMNENDDDNENSLADFNLNSNDFDPPPKPQLTKVPNETKENENYDLNDDGGITPEGFENLKSKYQPKKYNDNYIPYYNNPQNNAVYNNRDDLMKKLNYLIHMMEEQKDEKTKNVTEELVLYLFLGVFMIFTIDSFARASKYTR